MLFLSLCKITNGKAWMDMTVKKKVFWIATLIVLAAIVIVLCVSYFSEGQVSEFEGTLVELELIFPNWL